MIKRFNMKFEDKLSANFYYDRWLEQLNSVIRNMKLSNIPEPVYCIFQRVYDEVSAYYPTWVVSNLQYERIQYIERELISKKVFELIQTNTSYTLEEVKVWMMDLDQSKFINFQSINAKIFVQKYKEKGKFHYSRNERFLSEMTELIDKIIKGFISEISKVI